MMVVIFEDYQIIGRVRHESRKAASTIAKTLAKPKQGNDFAGEISVPQFKEYALNLVDRIFVSK
jgi:hypothetical protein